MGQEASSHHIKFLNSIFKDSGKPLQMMKDREKVGTLSTPLVEKRDACYSLIS